MKQKNNYFQMFEELVDYSVKAAKFLLETIMDFDPKKLSVTLPDLHKIEHEADIKKHEMMKKLAGEFLPPIERDDIGTLSGEIDEITDSIEDVLLKINMYNITEIRKDTYEFVKTIVRCCEVLRDMMVEFKNFRKSSEIHRQIVEINRLEEVGDSIYFKSVQTLFASNEVPSKILAWHEIYNQLEKCCDNCEHAADVVESVIMKNT